MCEAARIRRYHLDWQRNGGRFGVNFALQTDTFHRSIFFQFSYLFDAVEVRYMASATIFRLHFLWFIRRWVLRRQIKLCNKNPERDEMHRRRRAISWWPKVHLATAHSHIKPEMTISHISTKCVYSVVAWPDTLCRLHLHWTIDKKGEKTEVTRDNNNNEKKWWFEMMEFRFEFSLRPMLMSSYFMFIRSSHQFDRKFVQRNGHVKKKKYCVSCWNGDRAGEWTVHGDGREVRIFELWVSSFDASSFCFLFSPVFLSNSLSLRWDNDNGDGNMHSLTQFIYDAQSSTPSHFYYIFVFIIWELQSTLGNVCIILGLSCVYAWALPFSTPKNWRRFSIPTRRFYSVAFTDKNYARIECASASHWWMAIAGVRRRLRHRRWHWENGRVLTLIEYHTIRSKSMRTNVILHRNVDSSVKKFRFSFMFLCWKWS